MSKKARPPIPQLNGKIIETHCHLDYLSGEELEATMNKSRAVGIDRVITIAVSRDNQQVAHEIASQRASTLGLMALPHLKTLTTYVRLSAVHRWIAPCLKPTRRI